MSCENQHRAADGIAEHFQLFAVVLAPATPPQTLSKRIQRLLIRRHSTPNAMRHADCTDRGSSALQPMKATYAT